MRTQRVAFPNRWGDQLSGASLATQRISVQGHPAKHVCILRARVEVVPCPIALFLARRCALRNSRHYHKHLAQIVICLNMLFRPRQHLVIVREAPFTVLTIAPDGSWGVATNIFIGKAITDAMADCKSMSGPKVGCGYMSKGVHAGWVLGVRCGSENILSANKILANAELSAFNMENELRQRWEEDAALRPCRHCAS